MSLPTSFLSTKIQVFFTVVALTFSLEQKHDSAWNPSQLEHMLTTNQSKIDDTLKLKQMNLSANRIQPIEATMATSSRNDNIVAEEHITKFTKPTEEFSDAPTTTSFRRIMPWEKQQENKIPLSTPKPTNPIHHPKHRRESGAIPDEEEEDEDAEEYEEDEHHQIPSMVTRPILAMPIQSYASAEGKKEAPEFLFPLQDEDRRRGPSHPPAAVEPPRDMSSSFQVSTVPLMRLTKDILAPGRYDVRVRPVVDHSKALRIHISMSLYQIIEVNEPAQNIKMNVWMIQKWRDEMLHWDPREYDMINSTILPHEVLWIPDTYLYNSVVMNAEETERYMNIRADSLFWHGEQGSNMSFLYPAIYTVTCRLNIRYFPYDQQNCTLTISSWTNSKSALDYYADPEVNLASFIANEEWDVMSFRIFRHEYKYACCPEPWVILEASIVIRRKPLYYVINLIIPTSIITLVAITGFFTPASTADDRTEKINLGITTLLAMSILMLMVSDQMPTTSEFVPLIAWFYLSIIIIISIGTFLTSVILSIQGRRQYGQLPSLWIRHLFFVRLAKWLWLSVPPPLLALWEEMGDHPKATAQRAKKAEEDRREGKRLRKSLRRSQKHSQKSKAPSVAFEGESVVVQASPVGEEGGGGVGTRRSQFAAAGVLSPVSENGIDFEPTTPNSVGSSRAKRNWLRVSSIMSRKSNQSSASPRSPLPEGVPPPIQLNMLSSSRRSSEAATNWENAIGGLGVVTPRPKDGSTHGKLVNKTVSVSAEVNSMKVKRQCSLEWEFLATILDRLFLIIFSLTTIIVTLGMMFTGRVAQWQYEQAAKELGYRAV